MAQRGTKCKKLSMLGLFFRDAPNQWNWQLISFKLINQYHFREMESADKDLNLETVMVNTYPRH